MILEPVIITRSMNSRGEWDVDVRGRWPQYIGLSYDVVERADPRLLVLKKTPDGDCVQFTLSHSRAQYNVKGRSATDLEYICELTAADYYDKDDS